MEYDITLGSWLWEKPKGDTVKTSESLTETEKDCDKKNRIMNDGDESRTFFYVRAWDKEGRAWVLTYTGAREESDITRYGIYTRVRDGFVMKRTIFGELMYFFSKAIGEEWNDIDAETALELLR